MMWGACTEKRGALCKPK